jgi:glycosyltransferase involved in cell wall biosynthesis
VPELEVGAIACSLQYSLDHPQTTKEMGVQAHQLVQEKYTWERNALNLSEVYAAILKQHSIPSFY